MTTKVRILCLSSDKDNLYALMQRAARAAYPQSEVTPSFTLAVSKKPTVVLLDVLRPPMIGYSTGLRAMLRSYMHTAKLNGATLLLWANVAVLGKAQSADITNAAARSLNGTTYKIVVADRFDTLTTELQKAM